MRRESQVRLIKVAAILTVFGYSAASLAASGSFETSIAVDGDAIVEISNQSGAVVVRGGDVDEVTIHARITINKRYANTDPQKAGKIIGQIKRSPPVESDGNRIIVGELKKHTHQRYASISYEIVVPRDAMVTVHSVSGDVQVSGITGEVNATSDTGRVTVAELKNQKSTRSSS